jgi:hypothetical protein
MELTILMPCLNEAQTLPACIAKARAFIERSGVGRDSGQRQRLHRRLAGTGPKPGRTRRACPGRGYGAALITGIQAASGRFVIMGDGDDSYDFSQLEGFVAELRKGADLVMGNRFKGGIAPGAMPPLHRYLGNPMLSWLGRTFFRVNVGDFHCGLRGFSRDAMLRLGLVSPGMEFATEMVAKAALAGYAIREVPTTLSPDGRNRPPAPANLARWLAAPAFHAPVHAAVAVPDPRHLSGGRRFHRHGACWHAARRTRAHGAGCALDAVLQRCGHHRRATGSLRPAGQMDRGGGRYRSGTTWVTQARNHTSVEFGLVIGALVFLAGLAWSLALGQRLADAGFSALDTQSTMRSVIPAAT